MPYVSQLIRSTQGMWRMLEGDQMGSKRRRSGCLNTYLHHHLPHPLKPWTLALVRGAIAICTYEVLLVAS